MPASRDQLVHVALQVMFQGMQKDALEGIKALATNAKLRDSLLVELRVSMAARGIGTATGGSSIASAAVGGWTSDAVGDESASLSYKSSSSSYKSMLSAFAEEEEVLFPPLTYLKPSSKPSVQVTAKDGRTITIVEVVPAVSGAL